MKIHPLKKLREKLNLSQSELARLIGITPVAICSYESYIRTPKPHIFRKLSHLAEKNNIKLDYLDFF